MSINQFWEKLFCHCRGSDQQTDVCPICNTVISISRPWAGKNEFLFFFFTLVLPKINFFGPHKSAQYWRKCRPLCLAECFVHGLRRDLSRWVLSFCVKFCWQRPVKHGFILTIQECDDVQTWSWHTIFVFYILHNILMQTIESNYSLAMIAKWFWLQTLTLQIFCFMFSLSYCLTS